jgi:hypothetical protein
VTTDFASGSRNRTLVRIGIASDATLFLTEVALVVDFLCVDGTGEQTAFTRSRAVHAVDGG